MADKGAVSPGLFPILGAQACHGDDLVHDARQLQPCFCPFDLGFVITAFIVIRFFVQDADKPDVLVPRMLQMGQPRDHLLPV